MLKMKTLFAALTAASLLAPAGAFAQQDTPAMEMAVPVRLGDLEISGAWAKAMLPNQKVAGGFLTVVNTGAEDDRMIAVSSPSSPDVQMHEMAMDGEVMKMRQLSDGIPVPAGATVELAPGGLHLMFMRVPEPFKEGDTVAVTLTFEHAGTVELTLPVMPVMGKMMHGKIKQTN